MPGSGLNKKHNLNLTLINVRKVDGAIQVEVDAQDENVPIMIEVTFLIEMSKANMNSITIQ